MISQRTGVMFVSWFLFLALQFELWFSETSLPELWKMRYALKRSEVELLSLVKRNQLMYRELEAVKSGLEVIESHAREKLGLIKPNEVLVVIK